MSLTNEEREKYRYAREKFILARHTLAIGSGDVRSRLHDAFLIFHLVEENDLPLNLKKDFKWIMKSLTKFKPRNEIEKKHMGVIGCTLSRIKNATGVKIAKKIVYFADYLENLFN